ncbi:DUF739 family protein [Phascolarctobacterium sp.]
MTYDYSLLEKKIKEVFFSKERFAEKMGISRASLYSKLIGKTQFKQSEMLKALKLLNLKESELSRYFFNLKV